MGAAPYAAGGAAYSFYVETGIPIFNFIVNTPIRMVYLLLSPLPMYWRGFGDMLAFAFSSLFFGYSYYIAVKTLLKPSGQHKEVVAMLLLASLFSAFVFGWGVSNAGTAMRHRDKFYLQHMMMIAICYVKDYAAVKVPRPIAVVKGEPAI